MNELTKDLAESLKTGLLGMGITLLSLYVLSLLLDLMKVIFYRKEKQENTVQQTESNISIKEKTTEGEKEPEAEEEKEEELVAIITAALAAYLGKPQDMIKIGFIRRIHQKAPAWAMESRLNPKENLLPLQNQ